MKTMYTISLGAFLTRPKFSLCFLALAISSSCFDVLAVAHDHNNRDLKAVKVGLVTSLNEGWGKMVHGFVEMAISDFYHKHPNYKTRLLLEVRDSQNDVVTSAAIVEDLIKKEKVIAIIGPATSQEAQFDISLGERYKTPIISYSASSPVLSSPYFIQATQNDLSQVQAISSIIQAFGWREATPIYVNNEFGGGFIPFLVDALQQINTRIPYRSVISPSATDGQIQEELSKLRELQTRVFVVHMNETLAPRVFLLAKNCGMMTSEYVWIITSNIANALGTMDREVIRSMQGVVGVKTYVPKSNEVADFNRRRRRSSSSSSSKVSSLDSSNLQTSLYELWAYDATFLVANAVEQVYDQLSSKLVEVSNVGPELMQRMVNASFQGFSGTFRLVNGKLQIGTFEIINVIGSGEKEIGFWTSEKGRLERNLSGASNTTSTLNNKNNLGTIIWPGDSARIPKGWVTSAKEKLKIAVPFKPGFTEFVSIKNNDDSANAQATGFCIDVFDAVRNTLGYDLPVKYIPSNDSYDDLISQVYSGKYAGLVGDVTIIANRSSYVDFTLPYMESNVLMLVPLIKDSKSNGAWAFLRPLSAELWVTSLCFFILIAFVVWINEYQINEEFREDSWKGQIGLCLFHSFSTMVFSQKEVPKSNLSRFVILVWVFTLLLITQSYTASLASILTAEKLKPAYNDVDELVRTGKKVGIQAGTFVKAYLERMNFRDTNILYYRTSDQLNDLLSKGTEGGGIDAAFDEAPYIKVFLAGHCSKYTTSIPPVSRTDGFAFAFPVGSPLVSDISRGVLNVTEGEIMTNLSKRWLNDSHHCAVDPSSSTPTSGKLDLESFAALFGITGAACAAAIAWKVSLFCYENRRVVMRKHNGGKSLKRRLQELLRLFHANKGSSGSCSCVCGGGGGGGVSIELESSSGGSTPLRINSSVDMCDRP